VHQGYCRCPPVAAAAAAAAAAAVGGRLRAAQRPLRTVRLFTATVAFDELGQWRQQLHLAGVLKPPTAMLLLPAALRTSP